jgi:hypothetical protein
MNLLSLKACLAVVLLLQTGTTTAGTLDVPHKLSGSEQQPSRLNSNFNAVQKVVNANNSAHQALRSKVLQLHTELTSLADSINAAPTAGEFMTLAARVTALESELSTVQTQLNELGTPAVPTWVLRRKSDDALVAFGSPEHFYSPQGVEFAHRTYSNVYYTDTDCTGDAWMPYLIAGHGFIAFHPSSGIYKVTTVPITSQTSVAVSSRLDLATGFCWANDSSVLSYATKVGPNDPDATGIPELFLTDVQAFNAAHFWSLE